MANEKKLDCVILGLLAHEELSGYEIKARMDTALKYFWGASFGSIYPTLAELVTNGYAEKTPDPDSRRGRTVYRITKEGRDYLRAWLVKPVVQDEVRLETLLKIFFGGVTGAAPMIDHIVNLRDKVLAEMPELSRMAENLLASPGDGYDHAFYFVSVLFGLRVYQAILEWCDQAGGILGELATNRQSWNGQPGPS